MKTIVEVDIMVYEDDVPKGFINMVYTYDQSLPDVDLMLDGTFVHVLQRCFDLQEGKLYIKGRCHKPLQWVETKELEKFIQPIELYA